MVDYLGSIIFNFLSFQEDPINEPLIFQSIEYGKALAYTVFWAAPA